MNDLKIFENTEFGQIMILVEDGKELFPASQVAIALGYTNPRDAISKHCRCVVKRDVPHPQSIDKTMDINFIPEGDLYRLIVKSQLPAAERFERWVFEEVLPTIRRHGMYATAPTLDAMLADPDTAIRLFSQLKDERAARQVAEATVAAQKPKVLFADAVAASNDCISVGTLAKLLKQNGYEIGELRLYEWLRTNGYVIREKGRSYNRPTQRSMEQGLMAVRESTRVSASGNTHIDAVTLITGKGQQYFIRKFAEIEGIPQKGA